MLSVKNIGQNQTSVEVCGRTLDLINEGAHLIKALHMTFEKDFNRQFADEMIVLIGRMAMTDPDSDEGKELCNNAIELVKKHIRREK